MHVIFVSILSFIAGLLVTFIYLLIRIWKRPHLEDPKTPSRPFLSDFVRPKKETKIVRNVDQRTYRTEDQD